MICNPLCKYNRVIVDSFLVKSTGKLTISEEVPIPKRNKDEK